MKQNIYAMFVGGMLLLASCNDYLSQLPGRGTDEPLTSAVQLEGLLEDGEALMYEVSPTLCFSTDDFGATREVVSDFPDAFAWSDALSYFTWSVEDVENTGSNNCWEEQYAKIFTANLILNELDNVEGLTDAMRQNYRSEASFIRAHAYWWLVNHYAMPYAEENLEMPGVPLKRTTSYEESLDRQTLADAYRLIEEDLQEALKTNETAVKRRWRLSRPAVYAFMSRHYLFTGDYDKVIECADKALEAPEVTLHDYNELTRYSSEGVSADGYGEEEYGDDDDSGEWDEGDDDYDYEEDIPERWYPELYNYTPSVYADYQEFYYARLLKNYNSPKYFPSENLLALYDREYDLRFRYLMVENGAVDNGIELSDGNYQYVKFKSWQGDLLPFGPTIAEVLLNKAEAQARKGFADEAMATVNRLREKRMEAGSEYELTATSGEDALMKVLEERRRELPFVMRWFDIRRFAYNETPADDVAPEFDFFVVKNGTADEESVVHYSLPLKSRRYAVPISRNEINQSRGQIVQNQY
ncbi:MAG: RagB/SusD family nutrient uptake outer membrane protein [Odoribacter sp.]|nr:RagB/SusD family nutrient uptake outer membrane protein [Odoribacter sp.]